jgi:glucose/arabinose dehydrogenase
MKTRFSTLLLLAASCASGQSPEVLYQKLCSHCHGAEFQGGNAQSLVDGVWQFGGRRNYIARNIRNGITHLGMPAYGGTLDNKQVNALADYLLEAEKKAGVVKPPPPKRLQTLDYDITVEVWADGLDTPWDLAFLDEQLALITERGGRLRIVENGRLDSRPVEGTPQVVAEGQGGLLAAAFDPDYREEGNQWIYLAFSHGTRQGPQDTRAPAMTKIVRGRIDGNRWTDEETLFEAPHDTYRTARVHFGTRIVFDTEGNLYFSIGDRGMGAHAQDLSRPNGKIHRIRRDGSIPDDNPFRQTHGAMPSIFSYGHRNPQGLSIHPVTGSLWASEHGPLGGDELNLITAGANYGWPVITYGKNYNGSTISEAVRKEGMEQPAWYWRPSTAVCGIDFYNGNLFPKWTGKLLVGALKYEDVRVLDIEKDRVMHEELILKNAGRVRDVVCGPDGAIYIVLNQPGTILRLTPVDPP